MEWMNGVSRLTGKLTVRKTEDSAHSSQQHKHNVYTHDYPYMAESCGGADDDRDALLMESNTTNIENKLFR